MRNILVPKLFGFDKFFRFSAFAPPTCTFPLNKSQTVTAQRIDVDVDVLQFICIACSMQHHQDLMTSLVSLMTLIHFKTSYMILTKLGTFYWYHSGMF